MSDEPDGRRPTAIKLRCEARGAHVHVDLFIGPDADHLALSGRLVFRVGEWQLFGAALLLGVDHMRNHLEVLVDFPNERDALMRAGDAEDAGR